MMSKRAGECSSTLQKDADIILWLIYLYKEKLSMTFYCVSILFYFRSFFKICIVFKKCMFRGGVNFYWKYSLGLFNFSETSGSCLH